MAIFVTSADLADKKLHCKKRKLHGLCDFFSQRLRNYSIIMLLILNSRRKTSVPVVDGNYESSTHLGVTGRFLSVVQCYWSCLF